MQVKLEAKIALFGDIKVGDHFSIEPSCETAGFEWVKTNARKCEYWGNFYNCRRASGETDWFPDDEVIFVPVTQEVESNRPNISKLMEKLVSELESAFHEYDGITIPIYPKNKKDWSEDYAVVGDYEFQFPWGQKSKYFNMTMFRRDVEDYICEVFGVDRVYYTGDIDTEYDIENLADGELVVILNELSNEIEAYYKGYTPKTKS